MARKAGIPKKRGGVYYSNETYRGVRLRDCLHTSDWEQAKNELIDLRKQVDDGKRGVLSNANREWLTYTVSQALDVLIADREDEQKAERTLETDRQRSRPIKHLIGSVLVRNITAETIKKYQKKRTAEGVAGRTVNMEVTLLRLILKKAKRWARISDEVRNLRGSRDIVGRVLTQAEKVRLFQTARSQPDWYRAYYCGVIAVNTTGRKIEALHSRVRDVDFFKRIWTITRSKTPAGERQVDLNEEAFQAFAALRRIVVQLGGGEDGDYFFPACEHNAFDFTRHQKTVRTAWRSLTKKAGLCGFRLHDLRHQCLTEMAENDTPPDVMMSLAGHMSEKMRRHYIHVRDQAKKKAVAALPGTGLSLAAIAEPSKLARKIRRAGGQLTQDLTQGTKNGAVGKLQIMERIGRGERI